MGRELMIVGEDIVGAYDESRHVELEPPMQTLVETTELGFPMLPPLMYDVARFRARLDELNPQSHVLDVAETNQRYLVDLLGPPKNEGDTIDLYNCSAWIDINGKLTFAARTEYRKDQSTACATFWEVNDGVITPIEGIIEKEAEDPRLIWIGDKLVLSTVKVKRQDGHVIWRQNFKAGSSLYGLTEIGDGPWGMKDMLPWQKKNNDRLEVYTRPQRWGGPLTVDCGGGLVGHTFAKSLEDFPNIDFKETGMLFRLPLNEWVGINTRSKEGLVTFHRAMWLDKGYKNRKYVRCLAGHDPRTNYFEYFGVFGESCIYGDVPAKRPDLNDIIFPSDTQIDREKGKLTFVDGINDTHLGVTTVNMPPEVESFLERVS